ncbi:hypothetical protein [Streptomyces shenzhenensis]|uniref:Uncharacterized protein n=1 Tax=Streptomyces shenzhenensis TaxID=943815 RepID=A0A3M0HXV0_9ACTN|nr:hypothetical protein [Streptomyces shenzhenensis]RMB82071.1 hypothetical protein CTZ28_31295 [Streptomyces shenzhenensis]
MAKRDDINMEKTVQEWADRLVSEQGTAMDKDHARQFVRGVYRSAQDDLLDRNAQAEYEREE